METFGQLMFTRAVQAEQDKRGSRALCDSLAARAAPTALGDEERAFIESRDSFYMASLSETGWPYVQHRGGPAGVLRVIGPTRLGFADYRGNRQYVSTGNLAGNDRVSLFLMDYPRKGRLKILGHAQIVNAETDPVLAQRLSAPDAPAAERLVTIDVVAFDWNCPKYITPRLTEDEIAAVLGPRLQEMTTEIELLRARLDQLDPEWRNK
ncbi:pyridoxamine 5'-phosphate oxidase family protein [Antarctobacter jejuensis]|uniref:pyridoxamine 5'-phosphate oxidase family protein n=1 Tax=Antarctobacter jejuensis TaxID=1439938 RepID=UPI003FD06D33